MNAPVRTVIDLAQRAFWFLPAVFVTLGVLAGVLLPRLDSGVGFTFVGRPESARAILATIATVTVSVAGVTFSVIVVALILGSQQLSPRVMRTFRSQTLNQAVLGTFVAVFAYALLVLRTVGTGSDEGYVPHISVLVAVVLAIAAFALFMAFIGRMVHALEASSVIRRIAAEGEPAIESRYPARCGYEPEDPPQTLARAQRRMAATPTLQVRAPRGGFLRGVHAAALIGAATAEDALIAQQIPIGDFVITGDLLASVWCPDSAADRLRSAVSAGFELGVERTPVSDIGFPIRQLADVALRGVSPSTNDPTTAENAMDTLGDMLTRIAGRPWPPCVRVDADGVERLVARTPDLDGLVRLGFDQVRVKAGAYPVLGARLIGLLGRIDAAAEGRCAEAARQAELLVRAVATSGVIDEDVDLVRQAYRRSFGPRLGHPVQPRS